MSHVVRMIEQRKKNNEYTDKMNAMLADTRRMQENAMFEINNAKKIEKKQKEKRLEELRRQREASLLMRRRQLADLYNEEMEMWRQEALAAAETLEDRKKRIMDRAYALRDKREQTRAEYVKKALDNQWRDACDDARTLDSKAMVRFVNEERLAQIEEKIRRKQQLSIAENEYYGEWLKQLDEYDRKEGEKLQKREHDREYTQKSILGQIEASAQRKAALKEAILREDEEEIQMIRAAIAEDEALIHERHLEAYRRGKEVQILNSQVKSVRLEEERVRREQDKYLIAYAIAKEKEAEAEEKAKRDADKEAAKNYRKYLEAQMIKEAEDTAFVDEMRKREEEKVFKQREDALNARKEARDALMREVDAGRRLQISLRQQEEIKAKEEEAKWVTKFIEDAEAALEKDRQDAIARRRKAQDNQEVLLRQIAQRREAEELEQQEKYLADKHMQYIERAHQQKLAEQGGNVRNFRPIQKSQWYT